MSTRSDNDCVVVGASFAGLASAFALARAGLRVTVLEKKSDPGARLHTTGIIVKDAIDQIALLDTLPTAFVRRISGVRLYAPNLRHVDLEAPGYYFLATDTPAVMRWLASETERAGAAIAYNTAFTGARRLQSGFEVPGSGTTRFLIGADGPRSRVAGALGLGATTRFLAGVEYEYAGAALAASDKLHCFITRRLARGYIGWIFAGVNGVQAGLARRLDGRGALKPDEAMNAFLARIAPVIDLRGAKPTGVRAGIIPCGGVVHPVAASRALLVGDAAGMVSPVTAGGIHTALKHGLAAGNAVADFLNGRTEDPGGWFVRSYPKFRVKRLLRVLFDHFQSDLVFNWLLATRPMRAAASIVYFHHRGVFEPEGRSGRALALPLERDRPP
jgi:digeranylgeranylglycerophospholipid reductase